MMRRRMTRVVAGGLAAVMLACAVPAVPAKAEEVYREVLPYNLEEQEKALLDSESAAAYTSGAVTFPLSGVSVNMGEELVYHIFRQGNAAARQKVTLAVLDLSAGYGEDYEILTDKTAVPGKANRILDGRGVIYDVYPGTNVMQDEPAGRQGETAGNQDTGAGNAQAPDEPGQNGVTGLSGDGMNEEEIRKIASAVFEMEFDEGEQEKEIRIRAKVPEQAVGNKELQLIVLECEGDLKKGENTSTAVTLMETREVEEPEISIVEDSAEVVDGYVTVLVKRTGNTAGYSAYMLEAEDQTAVNGEDYILKSTQLTFSPGVSRQRVHIPLIASDAQGEKTFTLRAAQSEEEITYQAASKGAAFKSSRELVDIPMSEFEKGASTVGGFTFDSKDNGERYELSFDTGIGDGSNRSASIMTRQSYDFTGIKEIRLSASYQVGTIMGDHLDVYASNTDYCENKTALGQIESNRYGARMDTVSLTGQGIHNASVSRTGEYHIYITAEQHGGLGHIGYNLYNQEFDGNKGHLALVKQGYKLKILSPAAVIQNGVENAPAGDLKLTLTSDSSVSGSTIDTAYRDETYTISYSLMDESAHYTGYELLDGNNKVFYSEKTESPVFTLSSELIQKYSTRISDDTFTIRPVFERETSQVEVLRQDFAAMGMDTVNAEIDMGNCRAVYKDNGIEIATVTWNSPYYAHGDTMAFRVTENKAYMGDYHFSAYQVCSGASKEAAQTNPLYYTDPQWSTEVSAGYYAVTPMVSNRNARLLLNVSGASHGDFPGKPKNLNGDSCTVEDYDGKYDCNSVVAFAAKPADGYRAKWSYRDVASGQTKTYYGSRFYYRVQFPVLLTDNHVSLEFEKCDAGQEYSVVADVYMQGGDVLHQPDAKSEMYTPLLNANVSLEGEERITREDGSTEVFTLKARPDETYTALVTANNRNYIQEVAIGGSKGGSLRQEMKLSYYYEGPRVTNVRYFDYDGTVQNGDVIYLENETDGCILGATVEAAGQEVTDVLFQLKSADGTPKGEAVAGEHNGSEYLWSAALGMLAEQGDQIWVELVNRTYDEEGNVAAQTSYGEVNTGYSVVIAEFDDASYIPDTGDVDCNIPVLGNMYFLFSVKGIKPILTTSKSGNITYMTIGLNFGAAKNFLKKDTGFALTGWQGYANLWKNGLQMMSPKATQEQKLAGKQALKKSVLAVNFSVSVQLALYNAEIDYQSHLLCVGAWMSVGFNTSYTFNMPFTIEGFPMFVSLTVSGGFSDMLQVMPSDEAGYVDVRNMHDPTKSSYKPGNDFNVFLSIGLAVGAGVNGLLSVSGGGTGKMTFDWIDFGYGNGKLSLTVDCRIEALLIGRTFSYKAANLTMFDTNPYLPGEDDADDPDAAANGEAAADRQAQETAEQKILEAANNQMQRAKLGELKLRMPAEYHQSVDPGSIGNGGALISDAYEFSRPKLYPLEGGKYMVLATVDGSLVSGLGGDAAGKAVLSYAVYDSAAGRYESDADGKIFHSIEPKEKAGANGDSVNFHPCVTGIGDGKYVILWNSVLYGDKKDSLSLADMRTVIKAAVYDSGKAETDPGRMVYKSLVKEEEDENIVSGIVMDAVYDESAGEVVVLYRNLGLEGMTGEHTLADLSRSNSVLACTSLPVGADSLADPDTAFTKSVILAEGGAGKVLKTADLDLVDGRPVCVYHVTEGEQAGILNDAEEGSENHIYLTSLAHQSQNGYAADAECEVTEDSSLYHGNPKLMDGMLMWKQEGRMAAADAAEVLAGIPEDEATGRRQSAGAGIASMVNAYAGNMENFTLIKGEDGKTYALWTEGMETGTRVRMSVLEQAGGGAYTWGKGSTVFTTTGSRYIQAISPAVDAAGNLQALYRETVVDSEAADDGSSAVCLRSVKLGAKPSAVDYAELAADPGDQTEEDQAADKNQLENIGLHVSNLYPRAGETVTVTGKVRNEGVHRLEGSEVHLLANGAPIAQEGAKASVPALAAGEETEVVFCYTVPEDFNGRTDLSLSVPRGQTESNVYRADGNPAVLQSIYSGASLDIESIHYEPLHYADASSPARYQVTANIRNSGNAPSGETTLVLSHIELGEEDQVQDTPLGTCEIPALEPQESEQAVFEVSVGPEYFTKGEYRTASVGAAIYEAYGTDGQTMRCAMLDYLPVEQQPEALSLNAEKTKKLGIRQKKSIMVRTDPLDAKEFETLTYESLDESIARVDENGVLTGVKKGTCTVVVRTAGGLEAQVEVQVVKDPVPDENPGGTKPGDPGVSGGDGAGSNGTPGEERPGDGSMAAGNTKPGKKVKTGDDAGWMFWWILLLAGAGMAGGMVCYKKRRG